MLEHLAERGVQAGHIGFEEANRPGQVHVDESVVDVESLRRAVERQHRREMQILVLRYEVDTAWDGKPQVVAELLVERGVFREERLPGKIGELRVMARRAVQLRARECLVDRPHVQRVKRMQVENRLEVLPLTCLLGEPAPGISLDRACVEEDELAARTSDERGVGAEIVEARDLVRAADVPEPVGDFDHVAWEGGAGQSNTMVWRLSRQPTSYRRSSAPSGSDAGAPLTRGTARRATLRDRCGA